MPCQFESIVIELCIYLEKMASRFSSSSAISVRQSSSSPPPIRASLVPVPPASQPLSFSISRILGLGDASVQHQSDPRLVGKSKLLFIYC